MGLTEKWVDIWSL